MSQVAKDLAELEQDVEGLAVDRLPLDRGVAVRRSNDRRHGARGRSTGVSIVAVLRRGAPTRRRAPSSGCEAGDMLVVVGTPRGIEELAVLLRSG